MMDFRIFKFVLATSTKFYNAPEGVVQLGEILHASTRSLVRVVAGTMWEEGSQLALRLSCWLSWGARMRSVALPVTVVMAQFNIFSWGVSLLGHALGVQSQVIAPVPLFVHQKTKFYNRNNFFQLSTFKYTLFSLYFYTSIHHLKKKKAIQGGRERSLYKTLECSPNLLSIFTKKLNNIGGQDVRLI